MTSSVPKLEGKRKPDFFIVGAPRTGTTSLYNYLIQHSDIFMPPYKEPHFFGEWRGRPEKNLQEYLGLFQSASGTKAIGEASTGYLYIENAAEEIWEFRPDAKIIIGIRDPVDRAYSQYWHRVPSGFLGSSFEEELKNEHRRLKEGWSSFRPGLEPPHYYIEPGRYSKHVERYIKLFGKEQVMVYLFEDLDSEPEKVCHEIFKFLGVEPTYRISAKVAYNAKGPLRSLLLHRLLFSPLRIKEPIKVALPYKVLRGVRSAKEWLRQRNVKAVPEINLETRKHLQEVFRDDILYVQELTGRDLSYWLRKAED